MGLNDECWVAIVRTGGCRSECPTPEETPTDACRTEVAKTRSVTTQGIASAPHFKPLIENSQNHEAASPLIERAIERPETSEAKASDPVNRKNRLGQAVSLRSKIRRATGDLTTHPRIEASTPLIQQGLTALIDTAIRQLPKT